MIEIKNLRYTYENSKETVIRDLTLTVQDGEFVCVLGHSGCGKSTLIHLLAGLLPLQSGSITRDGRNMNVPGMDRAVVFQQYSLFPWQTVRGNVLFAMKKSCRFGKEEMERRADLFLGKTGMENAQDKYPYQGSFLQMGFCSADKTVVNTKISDPELNYQIAVKVDENVVIEDVQDSWSPEE